MGLEDKYFHSLQEKKEETQTKPNQTQNIR